jgi:aromatic-L-amino-acid decarboxylase
MLQESLPRVPSEITQALEDSVDVLDASIAQSRPRFLAYIGSSGLEVGAIGDFLASSYDINQAVDSRAATMLEQQTARWVGEFIGYPNAIGYFTSGGMVSNLTALATARSLVLPQSRRSGIDRKVAIYASIESHYSVSRAVEVLGIGTDALRLIEIDDHRRMRVDLLAEKIREDLTAGVTPIAIVATAGTTLTGAIDPIREIAKIAKAHRIWLHVDGAYGVPAAGTYQAPLFSGIEEADSITIDAHKWLFVPKSCSVVLMKNRENLAKTFSHEEAYMPHFEDNYNPVDLTLEYSRPLRALKLWIAFRTHGADAFKRAIEKNIELAKMTYEIASKRDDFRTLPFSPDLSIVPIQFQDPRHPDSSALNDRLCQAILDDGRFFISTAQIDGETWLRPCYTNFRTTEQDVTALFEVIEELSHTL